MWQNQVSLLKKTFYTSPLGIIYMVFLDLECLIIECLITVALQNAFYRMSVYGIFVYRMSDCSIFVYGMCH